MKSFNEMEELKRFQGSAFDAISKRKLIEDRDIRGISGQGMGKIGKIWAWNLTKVRNKKKRSNEARTKGAKVHFA